MRPQMKLGSRDDVSPDRLFSQRRLASCAFFSLVGCTHAQRHRRRAGVAALHDEPASG